MNSDKLLELITLGENSQIEFKSGEFRNESLAKEIVAFANMRGGKILIGVEDNGQISGVKDTHLLMEKIIQICRNNIQPPIIPVFAQIA
jgi:ATP-dependent DNA helicase RecG